MALDTFLLKTVTVPQEERGPGAGAGVDVSLDADGRLPLVDFLAWLAVTVALSCVVYLHSLLRRRQKAK